MLSFLTVSPLLVVRLCDSPTGTTGAATQRAWRPRRRPREVTW